MDIKQLARFYEELENLETLKYNVRKQLQYVFDAASEVEWPKDIEYKREFGIRIKFENQNLDYEFVGEIGITTDGDWVDPRSFIEHMYDATKDDAAASVLEEFLDAN